MRFVYSAVLRHFRHGALSEANLSRLRWAFAMALFAAAMAYAFMSLRVRLRAWSDFAFVYAAGETWLEGHLPYDFDRWSRHWILIRPPEAADISEPMPFVYPPHWAPIAMAFGLLPWPVASRIWDGVSVGAFFATCALCLELTPNRLREAVTRPEVWCFIALAALNPSLKYSVSHSQMTVLATFGVAGAFWAFRRNRRGWIAVFAFVAALKPQLGFLALVYIFVNGAHVGILLGGATAVVVASLALLPHVAELWAHLARSSELHLQLSFNAPERFTNLPTLLASRLSGREFMMLGPLLALLAVAAMTFWRRRNPALRDEPLLELGVICALTAALMPVHTYDLVIYVPIAILACGYRSSWLGLLLVPLYLFAGRAHVLGRFLPVNGSHLTGLMAVITLVLAGRRRATDYRVATPVANELARTAPAQAPLQG